MKGVTVIIPIFNPDSHRCRNLNYIIPKLLETNIKVIIMEQSNTGKPKYDSSKYSNIDHQVFYTTEQYIKKSWLINIRSRFTDTSHIWVVDCDFCTDFCSIDLKEVVKHDYTQPFNYARDLDREETELYISNQLKNVSYYNGLEKLHRHITTYGALSFIYRVEALESLGGMDEKYTGWGHEDFDLFLRIHTPDTGPKINIIKNNYSVHLWHPAPRDKDKTDVRNKEILTKKGLIWDNVTNIMLKYYYPEWHRL